MAWLPIKADAEGAVLASSAERAGQPALATCGATGVLLAVTCLAHSAAAPTAPPTSRARRAAPRGILDPCEDRYEVRLAAGL
jgi:hypothetical protein